jgi:hypothetical protein
MRLGVIFRFLVATFSAHALRTGAHLHAVCMQCFMQKRAICCNVVQNCMVTNGEEFSRRALLPSS